MPRARLRGRSAVAKAFRADVRLTAGSGGSSMPVNDTTFPNPEGRMRLLRFALLALLLVAPGCATVPVTGRSQLSIVAQSDLVALGAASYDELAGPESLSADKTSVAELERVGALIADAAEQFMRAHGLERELRHYAWEFRLVDADSVANAFCLPGGKIAAYTGILPVARDETGLAVVIGHEVAHAVVNHGGERMSQLLLAELGGMALAKAIEEKPRRTQELLTLAYGVGAQVGILLPYSRTQESEADRIGLILMASAGYDPRAAEPFWQRMAAQSGPRPPEFLSTHPASKTRIERIRAYMPEALTYYGR